MAVNNRVELTFAAKVDQASFKQLQDQLSNVNLAIAKMSQKQGGGLTEEMQRAKLAARDLQNVLDKSWNSKMGGYNMATFNTELQKTGKSLAQYKSDLSGAGSEGARAWNQMGTAIMRTQTHLKQSNKILNETFLTMKNTVKWGMSSAIFNGLASGISQAVQFAEKLDTSLNDIRIVTGKTAEEMKDVAKWANVAARELNSSTTSLTNAALIYYQQGDTEAEAQRKAEITTKVANVTQQDTSTAADQLTAVWNGYQVARDDMELYADKMAKVAAATASSFDELAAGMQKVAAAGNTAGVSFDSLNAQMSTIISVTREAPETVGTALKTIYARMGDLSIDPNATDEYGTKLGDVTSKMQSMGVDILDETGKMRDLGAVIEETGEKWQGWTDNQKQAAAIALAGKRQYTQLIALFDNWNMYQDAMATSQGAEGELNTQQDIYSESLAAVKDRSHAAAEAIYNDLFNVDQIKPFYELLTQIALTIDNIVKGLGGGASALAAMVPLAAKVFNKQISREIGTFVRNRGAEAHNRQLIANQNTVMQQGAAKGEQARQQHAKFVGNIQGSEYHQGSAALALRAQADIASNTKAQAVLETEIQGAMRLERIRKNITQEEYEALKAAIAHKAELDGQVASSEEMLKAQTLISTQDGDKNIARKEGRLTQDEFGKLYQDIDNVESGEKRQLAVEASDVALETFLNTTSQQHEDLEGLERTRKDIDGEATNSSFQDLITAMTTQIETNDQTIKQQEEDLSLLEPWSESAEVDEANRKELKEMIAESQKVTKEAEEQNTLYERQIALLQSLADQYGENANVAETLTTELESVESREEAATAVNEGVHQQQQDLDEQDHLEANLETDMESAESVAFAAQTFQNLTNAVAGTVSAIGALTGVWNAWKGVAEGSVSWGEFLAQTFLTLAMTGPMVVSSFVPLINAYKAFNAVKTAHQALAVKDAAVVAGEISAKTADLLVSQGLATQTEGQLVLDKAKIAQNYQVAMSEWAKLGPMLLVVGALALLAAGVAVAIKAYQNYESELDKAKRKHEEASQALNELTEAHAQLEEQIQAVNDSFDKTKDLLSTIRQATIGTDEWKDATKALNNELTNLIAQFPELQKYVEYDSNGNLVWKSETDAEAAQEEVRKKMEEQEGNARVAKAMAEVTEAQTAAHEDEEEYQTEQPVTETDPMRIVTQYYQDENGDVQFIQMPYSEWQKDEYLGNKYFGSTEGVNGEQVPIISPEAAYLHSQGKSLEGFDTFLAENKIDINDPNSIYGKALADAQDNVSVQEGFGVDWALGLSSPTGSFLTEDVINKYVEFLDGRESTDELYEKFRSMNEDLDAPLFLSDSMKEKLEARKTTADKLATTERMKAEEITRIGLSESNAGGYNSANAQKQDGVATIVSQQIEDFISNQSNKTKWEEEWAERSDSEKKDSIKQMAVGMGQWQDDYSIEKNKDGQWEIKNAAGEVQNTITDTDPSQVQSYELGLEAKDKAADWGEGASQDYDTIVNALMKTGLDKANAQAEADAFLQGQAVGEKIYTAIEGAIKDKDWAKDFLKGGAESNQEAITTNEENTVSAVGAAARDATDNSRLSGAAETIVTDALEAIGGAESQEGLQLSRLLKDIDWKSDNPLADFKERAEELGLAINDQDPKMEKLLTWIRDIGYEAEETSKKGAKGKPTQDAAQAADAVVKGETLTQEQYDALHKGMGSGWQDVEKNFNEVVSYDDSGNKVSSYEYTGDVDDFQSTYAVNTGTSKNTEDQDVQTMVAQGADDLNQLNQMYTAGSINLEAYTEGIEHMASAMVKAGEVTEESLEKEIKAQQKQMKTSKTALKGVTTYSEAKKALAKAEKLGKDSDEYKKAKENLKQMNAAAKAAALQAIKMGNAFNKVKGNLKEYSKAIKKGKKDSQEYKDAISGIQTAFKDGLGLDLDEDFIKENLDAIQKALQGDENSIIEIRAKFSKEQLLEETKASKQDIEALFKEMKIQLPKVSAGDILTDEDALIQKFNKISKSAELTKEQVTEQLTQMGLAGEVKLKKKHVKGYTKWVWVEPHDGMPGHKEEVEIDGYDYWYVTSATATSSGPSDLGATGTTDSGGSGGGGSKSKTEARDVERDPYYKVNKKLDQVAEKLQEINDIASNLSGEAYIEQLEKQNKLLERQAKLTKQKAKIADEEFKKSKKQITQTSIYNKKSKKKQLTALGKLKKSGISIDAKKYEYTDEDGNTKLDIDKMRADANEKFNKKYKGKNKNKKIEQAEKWLEEYIKALEHYSDSEDEKLNAKGDVSSINAELLSNNIELREQRIQLVIDKEEMQRQLDELTLSGLDSQIAAIENRLSRLSRVAEHGSGASAVKAYKDQAEEYQSQAKEHEEKAGIYAQQAQRTEGNLKKVIKATQKDSDHFPKNKRKKLVGIMNQLDYDATGRCVNGEVVLALLQKEYRQATKKKKSNAAWAEYAKAVEALMETVESELQANKDAADSAASEQQAMEEAQQNREISIFTAFQKEWELKINTAEAKKAIEDLGRTLSDTLNTTQDIRVSTGNLYSSSASTIATGQVQLDAVKAANAKINEYLATPQENGVTALGDYISQGETVRDGLQSAITEYANRIAELVNNLQTVAQKSTETIKQYADELNRMTNMLQQQQTIASLIGSDTKSKSWQNTGLYAENDSLQKQNEVAMMAIKTAQEYLPQAQADLDKWTPLYESTINDTWTSANVQTLPEWNAFQQSATDLINSGTLTDSEKEVATRFIAGEDIAATAFTDGLKPLKDSVERSITSQYDNSKAMVESLENSITTNADSVASNATKIAQNSVTALQNTMYDTVQQAFKVNGQFLADMQTEYQWLAETSKRYFDQTETPYQINSFSSYAEQAIANTDNLTNEIALKQVYQEQLKILQEKDKLSQYDVDRAKKLLDLEIKRQALEDARNNKTALKLRRDQSGNYSYQYVADPSAIAKAQSDYENAQNSVYELDKQQVQSQSNQFLNDMQKMQQEILNAPKNIDRADYEDEESWKAAVAAEVQRIRDKYIDTIQNDTTAIQDSMRNMYQSSDLNWDNMSEEEQQQALRDAGVSSDVVSAINAQDGNWTNWFDTSFGVDSSWFNDAMLMYTATDSAQQQIDTVMAAVQSTMSDFDEVVQQVQEQLTLLYDSYVQNQTQLNSLNTELTDAVTWLDVLSKTLDAANESTTAALTAEEANTAAVNDNTTAVDANTDAVDDNTKARNNTSNTVTNSSYTATQSSGGGSTGGSASNNVSTGTSNTVVSSSADTLSVGDIVELKKDTPIYEKNKGDKKAAHSDKNESTGGWKIVKINYDADHPIKVKKDANGKEGWIEKGRIVGFKTGGYTGNWNDITSEKENGKLAWLHQKELVLNAHDTENMLAAVGVVRDIAHLVDNLNNSAFATIANQLGACQAAIATTTKHVADTDVQQNIVINADFPNVQDSAQIEKAFRNLSNIALQKATKSTDITTATSTL